MDREPHPHELVALAVLLEHEGQYNIAKLLRAAATSIVMRLGHESAMPSDPEGQADLLDGLADRYQGSRLESLAAPLQAAAAALRSGSVALAAQAPDPSVCRVCGELRVHGSEERCPHCGRWSTSFERVRPVYWLRETTPTESLARLRDNLAAVEAICAGADPSDMRAAGPDGGWSAHQVVEHLHNAQAVFRGRIDQLLAGGEPELRSVQVWAMAPGEVATSELIDAYRTLRLEIIQLLGSAEHDAWDNRGFHEEWGWVTLGEQTSYFANHEPTHLGQLADAARWAR